MCEFSNPVWDFLTAGTGMDCPCEPPAWFGQPPSSGRSRPSPPAQPDFFQLRDDFHRAFTPQQRQAIAHQAAKLVYGILTDVNPIALLLEIGKLAILLSSSPTASDGEFMRELQQQLAIVQR